MVILERYLSVFENKRLEKRIHRADNINWIIFYFLSNLYLKVKEIGWDKIKRY
jgi:hypothetical protein